MFFALVCIIIGQPDRRIQEENERIPEYIGLRVKRSPEDFPAFPIPKPGRKPGRKFPPSLIRHREEMMKRRFPNTFND